MNLTGLYNRFGKAYKQKAIYVQTNMLLNYASKMLNYINATREAGISPDKNYTGNLQDSFVWAVYYNGKLKGYGFVSQEKTAVDPEKDSDYVGDIWGRELAGSFINYFNSSIVNGWEVVWASAVNYAAKLEQGTADPSHLYGRKWKILSQVFDTVTSDFMGRGQISIHM